MFDNIYGSGLIKGLYVTAKRFLNKKVTELYPEVQPNLPVRSRGSFGFDSEKCISCNLCADACPSGVIRVEFFKDEKGKKVLEKYSMNLGYCMFCGLCVEACPKDAVYFKTDFDLSCYHKEDAVFNYKGNVYKNPEVSIKEENAKATEEGRVEIS